MLSVQMLHAPETACGNGGLLAAFREDLSVAFGIETHACARGEGAEESVEECGHCGGHDEDCDGREELEG